MLLSSTSPPVFPVLVQTTVDIGTILLPGCEPLFVSRVSFGVLLVVLLWGLAQQGLGWAAPGSIRRLSKGVGYNRRLLVLWLLWVGITWAFIVVVGWPTVDLSSLCLTVLCLTVFLVHVQTHNDWLETRQRSLSYWATVCGMFAPYIHPALCSAVLVFQGLQLLIAFWPWAKQAVWALPTWRNNALLMLACWCPILLHSDSSAMFWPVGIQIAFLMGGCLGGTVVVLALGRQLDTGTLRWLAVPVVALAFGASLVFQMPTQPALALPWLGLALLVGLVLWAGRLWWFPQAPLRLQPGQLPKP